MSVEGADTGVCPYVWRRRPIAAGFIGGSRGELGLAGALRRSAGLAVERVHDTTPQERRAVCELSSRSYTLRKALRRMIEHDCERLAELSRRPGGPAL